MARPVKECGRCGGPREAGQRVSVDGRRVPACLPCARAPWPGIYAPKDRRRGRGAPYRGAA